MFVLAQNSNFERTISISLLVDELNIAANNGDDFILEDVLITYDPILDYKYSDKNSLNDYMNSELRKMFLNSYDDVMTIDGVEFKEGTSVSFRNCFIENNSYRNGIHFTNCKFSEFEFISDSSLYNQTIFLSKNTIQYLNIENTDNEIYESKINFLRYSGDIEDKDIDSNRSKGNTCVLRENKLGQIYLTQASSIYLDENDIYCSKIQGPSFYITVKNNNFFTSPEFFGYIKQYSNIGYNVYINSGLKLSNRIGIARILGNNYFDFTKTLTRKEILKKLRKHSIRGLQFFSKIKNAEFEFNKKMLTGSEKLHILDSLININDSIVISNRNKKPNLSLYGTYNDIDINNDSLSSLVLDCIIKESVNIRNLDIREYVSIEGTVFPNQNNIELDSSILKIGFVQNDSLYSGTEDYDQIKSIIKEKQFTTSVNSVIVQYRELIRIFSARGSELLANTTYKMKSVLTTKKQYDYYLNPSIENWFNWKGNLFLKWYSDYGQNPFKALSYCFWTMIYFAGFYFFFYSDWDKINKQFLMSKFDSLILYFSSNKKLEDIYFKNDITITESYVDFQTSIEKNKTFLPSFVILLAKPLYKFSLIRIYVRKRLFNSAEILSERTWLELSKNKRVLFGFVTLMIIFLYIIYLILVRGFNSLILSINAFSTLGFGQIPVNGFTKYVAIIEGFVGWFFLSIFLVSLLNQMINI